MKGRFFQGLEKRPGEVVFRRVSDPADKAAEQFVLVKC
jgi:hypothetical protein